MAPRSIETDTQGGIVDMDRPRYDKELFKLSQSSKMKELLQILDNPDKLIRHIEDEIEKEDKRMKGIPCKYAVIYSG